MSTRPSKSRRALSPEEVEEVVDVLHEVRFLDKSPAQIYAKLLDEGKYLCSIRTMYRILRDRKEVRERRNIKKHQLFERPELLATAPNQVWSWDITKLKGPVKWTYFYLYVVIDIFSRNVVGWTVATRESAHIAEQLFRETCRKQKVENTDLAIHSDRGAAMTSKSLALLFSDLGILKSFNRPHVSNDNPYSESQFKTFKYQPDFPEKFGSIEDAQAHCRKFFKWYNDEHYHSSLALMTPNMVHYGKAEKCNEKRQQVLIEAFVRKPERFVQGVPKTLQLPEAAWINPPASDTSSDKSDTASGITFVRDV